VGNNPIGLIDPFGLSGITIYPGTPPNSQTYVAPDGRPFLAPAGTNFQNVYNAGHANGPFNILGMNVAIGHYGQFDFQRNGGQGNCPGHNTFYPAYTNASNFAVGEYMNGAGFSLDATLTIGYVFAFTMSSNAGSPDQGQWWANGWNAAQAAK
jgi:hypothetical protein